MFIFSDVEELLGGDDGEGKSSRDIQIRPLIPWDRRQAEKIGKYLLILPSSREFPIFVKISHSFLAKYYQKCIQYLACTDAE